MKKCTYLLLSFMIVFASVNTTQSQYMQDTAALKKGYSEVNGIQMYYEIYGKGSPLVLIHGGGSTIQTSFGRILPLLSKNRSVIAVELQAHGRTSDRNAPLSFAQDANDVVTLLKNLNIPKADFLGFSNGAQTAMQIAISYPAVVNKLIFASGFYNRSGVPDGFWKGINNAQFSDMPQALKDGFLKINNDSAKLLNMFHRDVVRMQTFKDWSDNDLTSITAPALIIIGDRDVPTPEHAVAMHHLIPHSQLAIIPGVHGQFLGEITTLDNGKWKEQYVADLFEQFLTAAY
ncbi:alpha/beta hydrolase [Niastella koreensis]|uniref:Alpha/beta hydrolase fold protein n=3 Tax=Niastella koreensis TaxID=354356 RepID=G8TQ63_NIAKG|nr:alpha/beta hydrolase fold protein [Niastella koreensis GR20-10]OQP42667.1 alpha/beta hydrolase [Niastella koreensis]